MRRVLSTNFVAFSFGRKACLQMAPLTVSIRAQNLRNAPAKTPPGENPKREASAINFYLSWLGPGASRRHFFLRDLHKANPLDCRERPTCNRRRLTGKAALPFMAFITEVDLLVWRPGVLNSSTRNLAKRRQRQMPHWPCRPITLEFLASSQRPPAS